LGDTSLNCGSCLMLNLLGEADDDEGVRLAHQYMARAYKTTGKKRGRVWVRRNSLGVGEGKGEKG
jgi:hypothetical protein